MNLKEFSTFCNQKKCLRRTIYNEKTCPTITKQTRCFKKFTKKLEESYAKIEVDTKWEELKDVIHKRDNYECRLTRLLTPDENYGAIKTGFFTRTSLDLAHVVRRSQSKKLYYEPRNIVLLNRIFHGRLDAHKDPVTGKHISNEELKKWWVRMIGKKEWDWLQENK